MKFLRSFLLSRYPLAIVAGLVLAASFPNLGIAGFAWIAPGLLLALTAGKRGGESFRVGYVAGVAHYLASLYWLLLIPVKGFPILGWVALAAFLALYPATWVWLASRLRGARTPGPNTGGADGADQPLLTFAERLAPSNWTQRTLWALACAAIWVAVEMLIARIFGGFPWNLLGASQYRIVPLIQIASVTGVYGVSFLLVWTSVSLLNGVATILRRPQFRSAWIGEIILPLIGVVAALAFGFHQLAAPQPAPARTLKVGFVQPSIPQALIWNSENDDERFRELLRLSELALTNDVDVLLWPEAALPKPLRYDAEMFQAITNLAGAHRVWMIVGSDDVEPRQGSTDPKDANYYNSSFLISPNGQLMDRYVKRNLVIFGEYIPLERWLPFLKWFTPVTGSFASGDKPRPFELEIAKKNNLRAKTSVLICFEDNFPHLVREYAEPDTDFLVNLTNNGWFGEGAAQWQHAANAVFRTIENGLPLVRCTNNGLTCWVDDRGRLAQIFRDGQGRIYGAGFMTAEIPLLAPGEMRAPTFYHQHGDWFGWGCVAIAVVLFTMRVGRRKRSPTAGAKSL